MMFHDREDGGRRLGEALAHLRERTGVVVVGLPRGGVPVAARVAEALGAPLDVIVVRKLGVPSQPELAMGAIGEDDVRVVNDEIVRLARVSADELGAVEARERVELARRVERFRRGMTRVPLAGRHVIVVDDGIATGSTMRAACSVARAEGAQRITVAVPVAPADWTERLAGIADEFVAVETPAGFRAVGQFYRDFRQTSDDDVVAILQQRSPGRGEPQPLDGEVTIPIGATTLAGHLTVPAGATGLVVFAHGSGSSRHSPRNHYVAHVLQEAGLGTLLFDLLTIDEERSRANVFDIDLLANRLTAVTHWVRGQPRLAGLSIGLFGASTGAAAALRAAAEPRSPVGAVVSRGGRPDLAGPALGSVAAPTLLVVGGHDTQVLGLNRAALEQLRCSKQLSVVPGATHLFEEPGTLHAAAELARDWFLRHLTPAPSVPQSGSSTGVMSP